MSKNHTVMHLSYSDIKGGAAIACFRIHKAILNYGKYFSKILVKDKNLKNDNVIPIYKSKYGNFYGKIKSNLGRKVQYLQKTDNNILHSTSLLPSFLHKKLNNLDLDILHLHWIQSETISIESIGLIKKPIIWTLHDSWPFCGSEHHPRGLHDNRFEEGYFNYNRPSGHFGIDLDKWTWDRKYKSWKDKIQLVTPSQWMANNIKASKLMSGWKVKVIPSPVPKEFFTEHETLNVRQEFNLPKNKFLIFFSGYNAIFNYNKGWDLFEKIIEEISYLNLKSDIELVLLGIKKDSLLNLKIKTHCFEFIKNISQLSKLYSCADLICVTSRLESQCQIISEAQALGIPSIAFASSAISENIEHNKTGFLIKPFDCRKYVENIIKLKNNSHLYKFIKSSSKEFAKLKYNEYEIGKQYSNIYDRIINEVINS